MENIKVQYISLFDKIHTYLLYFAVALTGVFGIVLNIYVGNFKIDESMPIISIWGIFFICTISLCLVSIGIVLMLDYKDKINKNLIVVGGKR